MNYQKISMDSCCQKQGYIRFQFILILFIVAVVAFINFSDLKSQIITHHNPVYQPDFTQPGLGIPFTDTLNVYPNPLNRNATIEFFVSHNEQISLDIYNLAGKKIKTIYETELTPGKYIYRVTNMDLKAGMYFMKYTSGTSDYTIKLLVNEN